MKNTKVIARNILGGGAIIVAFLAYFVFNGDQMVSGLMEVGSIIAITISVYLNQEIKKERKAEKPN